MNAFEKCARAGNPLSRRKAQARRIKLPQVGAGRKPGILPAIYNQSSSITLRRPQRGDKLLQVSQHNHANLIARRMMKGELDRAVLQLPRKGLRFVGNMNPGSSHVGFFRYIDSIEFRKCAAMASRRSLPFAVKSPLSSVSGCGSI